MKLEELLGQHVVNVAVNAKTAVVVSAATTGTGAATYLKGMDEWTGVIATMVGIILSSVLIIVHWRRGKLEGQKIKLEIEALQEEKQARIEAAINSPGRRNDDP